MSDIAAHAPHTWRQVGLCVYCDDCGERLYQGQLPDDRRPKCDRHDWDDEMGQGFYFQCKRCGVIEWSE